MVGCVRYFHIVKIAAVLSLVHQRFLFFFFRRFAANQRFPSLLFHTLPHAASASSARLGTSILPHLRTPVVSRPSSQFKTPFETRHYRPICLRTVDLQSSSGPWCPATRPAIPPFPQTIGVLMDLVDAHPPLSFPAEGLDASTFSLQPVHATNMPPAAGSNITKGMVIGYLISTIELSKALAILTFNNPMQLQQIS
ncbi:hypothetical protein CRG98_009063 [Punica granatum]|uniref:Uncharacterized protein n=1 Tax=Punica granatum TaxID=22663 RepID=A0A2I0KPY4_PUNGR|nr:hypothetical protein CRG98_009063 [Punica granatum]